MSCAPGLLLLAAVTAAVPAAPPTPAPAREVAQVQVRILSAEPLVLRAPLADAHPQTNRTTTVRRDGTRLIEFY